MAGHTRLAPKKTRGFGPGWDGASIVALAGGVGGSRFARGLRQAAPNAHLTVIVNTGDDLTLHGLRITPDVDTVLYALAGVVDERRGWGPRGETFRCMEALERLEGETWFRLGDLDLATHLRRRELLDGGCSASEVIARLAGALGIRGVESVPPRQAAGVPYPDGRIRGESHRLDILPMSDDPVETWVQLVEDDRWVHFQEYFVRRRASVAIRDVRFEGIEDAAPASGVIQALLSADLIALCPSNPFVSLSPILAVAGVRGAIQAAREQGATVAGVSPIIGGATVKGPAARMLAELGHEPTAAGAARIFADLLDLYLVDTVDAPLADAIRRAGPRPLVGDALMRGRRGEARLARLLLRASLGAPRRT